MSQVLSTLERYKAVSRPCTNELFHVVLIPSEAPRHVAQTWELMRRLRTRLTPTDSRPDDHE